jgi:hypothetical protein
MFSGFVVSKYQRYIDLKSSIQFPYTILQMEPFQFRNHKVFTH